MSFGQVVDLKHPLNAPAVACDEGSVRDYLQAHAFLTLTLYSLLTKAYDTTTGRMAVFFGSLRTVRGEVIPVAVGHYSLWHRIMMHLYTGVSRVFLIGVIQNDVRALRYSLKYEDLMSVLRLTGSDIPVNRGRMMNHSLFVMPAAWLRTATKLMQPITRGFNDYVQEVTALLAWCPLWTAPTGTPLTVETLKQFKNLSASDIRNVMHSCHAGAAFRLAHEQEFSEYYNEFTPSFGIEWSQDQLQLLVGVRNWWWHRAFDDPVTTAHHQDSFFVLAPPTTPLRTCSELFVRYPRGLLDDGDRRDKTDPDYNRKKDRQRLAGLAVSHRALSRQQGMRLIEDERHCQRKRRRGEEAPQQQQQQQQQQQPPQKVAAVPPPGEPDPLNELDMFS